MTKMTVHQRGHLSACGGYFGSCPDNKADFIDSTLVLKPNAVDRWYRLGQR
jgi:hypothetical protein